MVVLYLYPSLHENLHSVSTTMRTPFEAESPEVTLEAVEQTMSPFLGDWRDGHRRNTHLINIVLNFNKAV